MQGDEKLTKNILVIGTSFEAVRNMIRAVASLDEETALELSSQARYLETDTTHYTMATQYQLLTGNWAAHGIQYDEILYDNSLSKNVLKELRSFGTPTLTYTGR